jgi:DNA ligase (NAD+)
MNLINEIRKVRDNPVHDYDILASFNISGIGTTLSKKILKHYTLKELMNLSVDDLQSLEQIGPERAILIEGYLRESKDSVEQILSELTIKESKNIESKNTLKICFTGSNPLKRDEWVKIAEKNGFEYIKSVTKELNVLVTDDINSSSNKNKKAKKYDCKVITYEQFTKLLLNKTTK